MQQFIAGVEPGVSGGGVGGLSGLEPEFELLGELGRGGTAVVYRARERELGREVAIKVIREAWAEDPEILSRFAREARLAARLEHPNIVGVHSVRRVSASALALVMQFVPGRTLKEEILRTGPLPAGRVERVLREVGAALACAHAHGIVHRDVKPDNIFIDDRDGRAVLADFGVARPLVADAQLTVGGVALGTPTYMSPEQIDGGPVDHRSDLYSFGLVAWEMLAGEAPWEGESLYSVLHKQKTEQLPPLRRLRPDAPARLRRAVEGAIRKDPDHRWPDIDALLGCLDGADEPRWPEWPRAVVERLRGALERRPAPGSAIAEDAADPLGEQGGEAPLLEASGDTVVFRRAEAGPPPEPDPRGAGDEPSTIARTANRAPGAALIRPWASAAAGRLAHLRERAGRAAGSLRPGLHRPRRAAEGVPPTRAGSDEADAAERRLCEWLELRAMMDARTLEDAARSRHPRWHLYPGGRDDHRALREVAGLGAGEAEVVMQTYGALDALLRDDPAGVERRTGGEIPAADAERILAALRASPPPAAPVPAVHP